jgi:Arc/MetJ-type ribon-helix-helix transcriptional regulator
MEAVTVKLAPGQIRWLDDQANGRRRSRSAILRDLIEERRAKQGAVSLHDRSKDLCGSLAGPKDLSTRRLKSYGRD